MDDFELELKKTLRRNRTVEVGADEIGSARGLVTEIFRFKSRLIAVASIVKVVVLAVLFVLFAVVGLSSTGGNGGYFLSLVCLIALATLWQFHWMLLNRNAVLRELKRIEVLMVTKDLKGSERD